ncbi:hypothetical protein QBC38DRAFT_458295 [Podospora fimiseda]|uniref:C2H2-type domain-containing protein n=1 Tax=Podospora fimiseda TaxID=252190 RepID=A0AAN7GTA2_9PEZI|nr:hypothetical protein QBC38DRAFT_458295 [Podospora fimiseda]
MENHQQDFGPLWDEQYLDELLATTDLGNMNSELLDESHAEFDALMDSALPYLDSEASIQDTSSHAFINPQLHQGSYSPVTEFVSPISSSNFNWTPPPWEPTPSISSLTSDPIVLSPDQSFFQWPPFVPGELQNSMLFEQNLQIDPGPDISTVLVVPDTTINVQGPLPDVSAPRTRHRRHARSATPTRERRKKLKPVKCPICNEGFAYALGMERHVRAKHHERAQEFNISTDRFPCELCDETFARRDHLVRHCQRKHGWSKSIKGAPKKRSNKRVA